MNNVLMRKVDVTESYQPLAVERTVVTVTISCPPGNGANVLFKGDDGSDVPWLPGEWHTLVGVNLADIQVKGTVGDCVTLVGGSW
ncbi:MAG: hypothetical protein NTX87_02915 [Planctomycetota bacterium]|nr:hypothetical protein [Planctomycetota bacterium]